MEDKDKSLLKALDQRFKPNPLISTSFVDSFA